MLVLVPAVLMICAWTGAESTALLTLLAVCAALVPFFLRFETERPKPREMMPVVVLSADLVCGGAERQAGYGDCHSLRGLLWQTERIFVRRAGCVLFKPFFRTGTLDTVADVCLGADRFFSRRFGSGGCVPPVSLGGVRVRRFGGAFVRRDYGFLVRGRICDAADVARGVGRVCGGGAFDIDARRRNARIFTAALCAVAADAAADPAEIRHPVRVLNHILECDFL